MGEPDIVKRVLEFMLREQLEDRTLNSLVSSLPLLNNNLNFQKLLLLKKLGSDVVSRDSISETTLEWLEILEEIDFRQGIQMVSDAMKRAYCAVAVECTLKHLAANGDDSNNIKGFFEVVKRLWKGRIDRMEKGGLGSDKLWMWRDEIVAALWDDSLYESVVDKISMGLNVVDAVGAYAREAKERMRSELAAKSVVDGADAVKQVPSHHGDVIIISSDSDDEILMEPDNSAHTRETTEPVDEPKDEQVLRVPRRRPMDNLKKKKWKKKKRRKRLCWTRMEEEALRAGVNRFGKGNWVCIANEYRDKLGRRTDVDLKDKWRNMTK